MLKLRTIFFNVLNNKLIRIMIIMGDILFWDNKSHFEIPKYVLRYFNELVLST
jgi:hypothetical protein